MRRDSAAIVLMMLSIGCMHETKPQTQPPPVAAAPETSTAPQGSKAAPATKAKSPAPVSKAKAVPAKTAPSVKSQAQPTPPAKAQAQLAPPAKQATAPGTLDLEGLKARLRQTKAIGVMTKLSLKNKVDDLLDEFRQHHAGKPMPTVSELRRAYDLLMMKVLSLLQDKDKQLASDILSSREGIWGLLADPKKFAALQAE